MKEMDYEFKDLYLNTVPLFNVFPETVAFVVGRFQPFHNGHKALIEEALKISEHVVVFIGSVQESRTDKNPYTYEERKAMIETTFKNKVTVAPLKDYPSHTMWVEKIKQKLVLLGYHKSKQIFVCCNKNEETIESNNLLSDFETHSVIQPNVLNATDIRRKIFQENVDPLTLTDVPVQTKLIISYLDLTIKPAKFKYNI
jgi:bifunctional NMN adenylyltransferase/nudix hydrolase